MTGPRLPGSASARRWLGVAALGLAGVTLQADPVAAEDRAVIVSAGNTPGFQVEAIAQRFRQIGFATTAAQGLSAVDLPRPFEALEVPDPAGGARIVVLAGQFVSGGGEVWLLGGDARRPGLAMADRAGIGVSRVIALMRDSRGPRIVLLAEASGQDAPGQRLRRGVGTLPGVAGVSVVAGPPGAVSQAAQMLSGPDGSLAGVLLANPELRVVSGPATGGVVGSGGGVGQAGVGQTSVGQAGVGQADGGVPGGGVPGQSAAPGQAAQAGAQAGALTVPAQPGEAEAWVRAAAQNSVESYRAFHDAFPTGRYAAVARDRLGRLGAPLPDSGPTAQTPGAGALPPLDADRQPALTEIALNLSLGERSQMQQVLTQQGFDTGGSDGQFGRSTREALRAWQAQAGLPATGYVDDTTLRRLQQLAPR